MARFPPRAGRGRGTEGRIISGVDSDPKPNVCCLPPFLRVGGGRGHRFRYVMGGRNGSETDGHCSSYFPSPSGVGPPQMGYFSSLQMALCLFPRYILKIVSSADLLKRMHANPSLSFSPSPPTSESDNAEVLKASPPHILTSCLFLFRAVMASTIVRTVDRKGEGRGPKRSFQGFPLSLPLPHSLYKPH